MTEHCHVWDYEWGVLICQSHAAVPYHLSVPHLVAADKLIASSQSERH